MADEHEADDVLDLTEDQEVEAQPEPQDEAPEEFHLELEGEEAPIDEPNWARQLRLRNKDLERDNKALRESVTPQRVEVGPKPDLWSDEISGDPEKYDAAMDKWRAAKQQNEQVESKATEQARIQSEGLKRAEESYRARAAKLPVKGYDEIEARVKEALPPELVTLAVRYIPDLPKIVLALDKYPAMLTRVSNESDVGDALMMLKDMERKIKTGNEVVRKAPPAPEADTIQRGTVSTAPTNSAKKLEALEKEAARTGNRTPIIEYKRQLKMQENRK